MGRKRKPKPVAPTPVAPPEKNETAVAHASSSWTLPVKSSNDCVAVPKGKCLVPLRAPSPDAPSEVVVKQLLHFGNAATMLRSLKELPDEYADTLAIMLARFGSGQTLKSVELASLYDILKSYHLMTPLLRAEGGRLLELHRKAVCALIVYLGVKLSSDRVRTENEVVCAYIGQLVSSMVTAGFFDEYSDGIQRITREVLEKVFADIALLQPSAAKKECEKDTLEELYDSLEGCSLGGESFRERVRQTKQQLADARAKDSAEQLEAMIERMKAGEMPEDAESAEELSEKNTESLDSQCKQLQALVAQMQELGSSCHARGR